MMIFGDDYGCGTWPVDTFDFEVDLLVISLYKAASIEIEAWDREQKQRFHTAKASFTEESAYQIECWNEQVATLRCHAGNMGLVSLITMFEHWLKEFEKGAQAMKILPNSSGGNVVKRFLRIEKELGHGLLSSDRLSSALDARNAIVHHASAREYEHEYTNQSIAVKDEFLGELRQGEFQVGISGDVLSRYSHDIKQQAALWFSEAQKRIRQRR